MNRLSKLLQNCGPAFFFAICMLPMYGSLTPNQFTDRDFFRAINLADTWSAWLGPELSSNGMNLGPFLYVLLHPLLYFGFETPFVALIVGHTIALALIWNLVRRHVNTDWACVLLCLLGSSPVLLTNLRMTWNPSYIFFFATFFIYLLDRWRTESSIWFAVLLGAMAGCTLQIHIIAVILIPFALAKLSASPKNRSAAFLLTVIALQLPAFFRESNPQEGVDQALAMSRVFEAADWLDFRTLSRMATNLVEFLGVELLLFFAAAFTVHFGLGNQISKKRTLLLFGILGLSIFFAQRSFEKRLQLHYILPALGTLIYSICYFLRAAGERKESLGRAALVTVVLVKAALLTFALFQLRDGTILAALTLLIGVAAATAVYVAKRGNIAVRYFAMASVLIPAIFVFAANVAIKSRFVTLNAGKEISKVLYDQTSWQIEDFDQRVLQYFRWPENSLRAAYQSVARQTASRSLPNLDRRFAVLIDQDLENGKIRFETRWRRWLKTNRVQKVSETQVDRYLVLLFDRLDSNLPTIIQNVGAPYRYQSVLKQFGADYTKYSTKYKNPVNGEEVIDIWMNRTTRDVVLSSKSLSRYQSAGTQLFFRGVKLNYTCGGKTNAVDFLDVGYPRFELRGLNTVSGWTKSGLADVILSPTNQTLPECGESLTLVSLEVANAHIQNWDESGSERTRHEDSNLNLFLRADSEEKDSPAQRSE